MKHVQKRIPVAQLRVEAALTQAEVGRELGWTQPTVSEWERTRSPTLGALRSYVEACGGTLTLVVELPTDDGKKTFELEDPADTKHYGVEDGWGVQFRVNDRGPSQDPRKGPRIGKKR